MAKGRGGKRGAQALLQLPGRPLLRVRPHRSLLQGFKSNKIEVDATQLKAYSCDLKFTDKELDIIEMAVYGDVIRPGKQCRRRTVAEMLSRYKSKDDVAACQLPCRWTCGQNYLSFDKTQKGQKGLTKNRHHPSSWFRGHDSLGVMIIWASTGKKGQEKEFLPSIFFHFPSEKDTPFTLQPSGNKTNNEGRKKEIQKVGKITSPLHDHGASGQK
ncbi:hypothetical protein MLD38_039368 [Melastoma candidum]|uniref:Uncharacterized protein n=1 Tax=Melastoma candidum TaxID=119954 RepID=A0ACB9L319_9MYRT|nr:hypothetical protein MLD38_039368 [Melastoma candidum]